MAQRNTVEESYAFEVEFKRTCRMKIIMYEKMKTFLMEELKIESIKSDVIGSGVYTVPPLPKSSEEMQKHYELAKQSGYGKNYCQDMLKQLESEIYICKTRPIC